MRRIFSAVFLILGAVILLGMPVVVLCSLNRPAALLLAPDDAIACAEELTKALSRGDFETAQERIWGLSGEPEAWEPADEVNSLIWQTYLDSVECNVSFRSATQIGVAWNMTVSTMDIAKVADAASETAGALWESREGEKQRASLLYEAAQRAIKENSGRIVREIRLELVWIDGAWYALPDEQLLLVLSGNLRKQ